MRHWTRDGPRWLKQRQEMALTLADLSWITISFVCGSLPFSVWIGRLALRRDIRGYGDGNPGATNVFRAGGKGWGALAIVLDFLKAAIPVGLATFWAEVDGPALAATALAAPLGHAFSPFLGFRGGKALAASFGMWTGLTLWAVPVVLGVLFAAWYLLLSVEGWAVVAAMLCLLPGLLLWGDPMLVAVWAGNTALLGWKHRVDLSRPPSFRFMRAAGAGDESS